jgi:Zn-dependent protease with chaperone function
MADRKSFPGISPDAFLSDGDRWALEQVKRVPLFPNVIRKFYDLGVDRWMYCTNMGMSVRCGPRQYSKLYSIFQESCQVLDMAEPELYLSCNPNPNAFAGGVERPYVTIFSSMVNTLSDEQLYFLFGHELGHIKAEHVLYFSVCAVLFDLLYFIGHKTLGASDVAAVALAMAFYEWVRQAEFSADRCGLLVSQSLSESVDSLISFTAGPNRMSDDLSRDAFMDQAKAYQSADTLDQFGKAFLFYIRNWRFTHPFPVVRVQELDRWHSTGALTQILNGKYPKFMVDGAA